MRINRHLIALVAALATLGLSGAVLAQQRATNPSQVSPPSKVVSGEGESLLNSEGTWTLTKDGETSAGYAVRLNGKPVGYAASMSLNKDGLPVVTHRNGNKYIWTGSTFKPTK